MDIERYLKVNTVIIPLYAAILFGAGFLIPTYINPKAYDAHQKFRELKMQNNLVVESPWVERPEYPLKSYVILLAPLAGGICYGSVLTVNRLKFRKDLSITIFTFLGLTLLSLIVGFNFSFDITYVVTTLGFSGIICIMYGLRFHEFKIDFITDTTMPVSTRIERLKYLHDKWSKGLNLFMGITIAVLVSGSLNLTLSFSNDFGLHSAHYLQTGLGTTILIIAPGIGLGIIWQVFQKMSVLENRITDIKE